MAEFKGQSRLPKFAAPKRYDIKLVPDLQSCQFSGSVSIHVDIVAATRFIVLNAADLTVHSGSVSFTEPKSSKVFQPSSVEIFEADEILVVEFAEALPIGVGVLAIGFEGILNDKMKGFYRSTYEQNGEKKNMAVTQFQPADARRCFPCWDEPACKATFKITLDVPSELVALSNMPVIEEKVDGHLKTVSYQESPIMSTYLVAIVVGLFDFVEDHTSDGIKVRVYGQVGKANQGKFALHVAVKTLELYKEYFAVPYPLPKLDMVAVPDFAFGAMENYGLIIYREIALLYDDQHSAAANKQGVATTVAHELAHQWFGNLVTMEWWTDLWLNEGFATWVSYLANDSLFPEWKVWTQFLDGSIEGLRLDGLEGSHPIEVEIRLVSQIQDIFDAISYKKGASVIRMLQSYIGAECFQRSLALYIERHAFSNAKTEDLWAALEEGSGEPVNRLMSSWTKQTGYPVVSIKVKDQKLEIQQSRFLYGGSHGEDQWIVPITLCCDSYDNQINFLLESKSVALDTNKFGLAEAATGWIKLNVNQTGFYRVKYDEGLTDRLRYAIENKYLTAPDRLGILDDAFALCMASQQSLSSLLTLMKSYSEELEHLGKFFRDKEHLKKVAGLFAMKKGFDFIVKKSGTDVWYITCKDPDCGWRLRGKKKQLSNMFEVTAFENVHTCSLDVRKKDNRQASPLVVAELIKDKFSVNGSDYLASKIREDMENSFGIEMSYEKAWRCREKALHIVRGTPEASYSKLPGYLHMLQLNNPDSITDFKVDEGRFKYCFFSLGACRRGFKFCRPVICIDGSFLKTRYGGQMLCAVALDSDSHIFPIAFAIVDSENHDSWTYFMRKLKQAIGDVENLAFVSDRHQSIVHALELVFPDAPHGACYHHIIMNVASKFKTDCFTDHIYSCAYSYKKTDFEREFEKIKAMDVRVALYLEGIGFERWVRAYFPGDRYNVMTSNWAESFNSKTKDARAFPITAFVEFIRFTIQTWFVTRKENAEKCSTTLSPVMEGDLSCQFEKSRFLSVDRAGPYTFNVHPGGTVQSGGIVDLEARQCSCGLFQIMKIPCPHACAAAQERNISMYALCSQYYTRESWKSTYEGTIMPVGDEDDWELPEDIKNIQVGVPIEKKPVGRPKKQKVGRIRKNRYPSNGDKVIIQRCCSKCGGKGHNKASCKYRG